MLERRKLLDCSLYTCSIQGLLVVFLALGMGTGSPTPVYNIKLEAKGQYRLPFLLQFKSSSSKGLEF